MISNETEKRRASGDAQAASTSAATAILGGKADRPDVLEALLSGRESRGLPLHLHAVLGHWASSTCVGVQGSPTQSHHHFWLLNFDRFERCMIYRGDRFVL